VARSLLFGGSLVFAANRLLGQDAPSAAVAPTPAATPATFEARMKVALSVRVIHSIVDVTPGMSVDAARAKLAGLADPKTPPAQEGGDDDEDKDGKSDKDADQGKKDIPAPRKKPLKAGDDDDDAEGTRILWKLKPGSPYEWVFIEAGKDEKVATVFGYCWPDKPIPFDEIGDVSQAPIHTPDEAAWDSMQPPFHYRIYATGSKEHAAQVTISFFALQRKSGAQPAGH
jgi:hypothetical protein